MKRVKKTVFLAVLMAAVFLLLPVFTFTSRADDGSGIDDGGVFDDISGVESYDCYYFDVEELGVLDAFYSALNSIGNLLWNAVKLLTKLVMMILYVALSFDAGDLLSPFISGIQSTIHDNIFEPLFVLAYCGTAVILLKRIVKRDLMGALGDILKVVVIVVLSIALVKKSDSALSMVSQVTKETSVQVMVGINDSAEISDDTSDTLTESTKFALGAAELLWVNLVEEPWKSLEFAGTDPTEDDIKDFLSIANAPGSENRDTLVANYSGAGVCFAKIRTITRLACIIVYLVPFLLKCVLYIAVAAVQLIMQIITVVYVLIAPVILMLALLPGYESVVGTWLKKVLETQLGILIITFLLGIIIKVDSLLYDMMDIMGGFLVVSIMQMIILAGIYFGKDKILGMLSTAQHLTPQDVNRALGRTGDVYSGLSSAPDKIRSVRERFMTDEQTWEHYVQELEDNGFCDGVIQQEQQENKQKDEDKSGQSGKESILQTEGTDSEGEDYYAGNGEVDGSQGEKRAIIKKKNSELKNGLPLRSEYPNVAVDNVADDGHVYQRRLYNENCIAEKDFDTDDHNRPKAHPTGAHKHTFQGKKRSTPQYLTEEELEENSDIIQRGVNYHDKG